VRHLGKSIRAVAKGLGMPRLVLAVSFGIALRPSRPYEQVVEAYEQVLAGGADAGRFAPSPRELPADPAGWRREVMDEREEAADALARVIGRWSERALDRHRLPHQLLGKLTVREMLFFTLHHNLHHVRVVERRRAELPAARPS